MESKKTNSVKVKKSTPGSIFLRGQIIWVKYKGKSISLGIKDTPANRKTAVQYLEQLHLKAILNGGELPITSKPKKITFEKAIEEYLESKRKKNHKEHSIIQEQNFFKLTFPQGKEVNAQYIDTAIKKITNSGYKPNTVNVYLSYIQKLAEYLKKHNYLSEKYKIDGENRQKVPVKEPEIFTQEEYNAIYKHINEKNKEVAAYISLLWHTGLRREEAANLKISDIDLDKKIINLKNKITSSAEYIPIPKIIIPTLEEMIEKSKKNKKTPGKIFKYSTETAYQMLKEALKTLKIKENIQGIGLHTLRRSYSTKLIDKEIPVNIVQKLMRHSSINTTLKLYTKTNASRLQEYADIGSE